MLSSKLQEHGVKTFHVESDTDLLIVQTAVDSAANSATTVVGEDTDLLVLLCLHADVKSQPLFFKSEKKQTAKKNHKVWHINRPNYRRFCAKVATSKTTVQVQSLPPTSAAARTTVPESIFKCNSGREEGKF